MQMVPMEGNVHGGGGIMMKMLSEVDNVNGL